MKTLQIDNTQLSLDKKTTALSSDTLTGSGTLSVDSILGFTNNSVNPVSTQVIVLIGEWGSENSEIILTTSAANSDITLSSNTLRDHQRGDKITLLDYNQIEISWEAGLTPDSDTILTTMAIQADQKESIYNDSAKTSGYYFIRFRDSVNTTYSDYSNAIPYVGYADNTVFKIKERALNELGEVVGELITNDFLNQALDQGRRDLDNDSQILRWSFRQKFDQDIGNVLAGMWKVAVPTDLKDKNTNKNIQGLRIGKDGQNLEYQDWNEFRQNYRNVPHTTLNGDITTSNTEVVLTASGDFDDSGDISIAASVVDEEIDTVSYAKASIVAATIAFIEGGAAKDTITDSDGAFITSDFYAGQIITVSGSTSNDGTYEIYSVVAGTITLIATDDLVAELAGATVIITSDSANVITSNTLSGITGIQAAGHATGQEVWQNISFGLPTAYSIHEGYIYFDVPFSDDYAGENVWMDYYSTIVAITDDATTLDEPEFDLFVSYLKFRIKSLKANGKLEQKTDSDWIEWTDRKTNLINKEIGGQEIHLIPS
jgi:hypothetical protein